MTTSAGRRSPISPTMASGRSAVSVEGTRKSSSTAAPSGQSSGSRYDPAREAKHPAHRTVTSRIAAARRRAAAPRTHRRIAPSVSATTVPIAPAPIRMTPSVKSGSTQPNGARRWTRKLPRRTVPPWSADRRCMRAVRQVAGEPRHPIRRWRERHHATILSVYGDAHHAARADHREIGAGEGYGERRVRRAGRERRAVPAALPARPRLDQRHPSRRCGPVRRVWLRANWRTAFQAGRGVKS